MAIEKSYVDMLKERDAIIVTLKELLKLSHEQLGSQSDMIELLEGKIFKQSQESKEAVSRAIEIILEKDDKITELDKELSALRCVAQSSRPSQGFFTIDQAKALKDKS
jgi:hypothetical protein